MYKFCVISLYMDMIWCSGGLFVLVTAVLISPVLACVIGNTLRVRERHNSGRRIIQDIPSPRSYNRQECWIIKTPGLARAECDGEPALSSQWANCSGATPWYNCHQMWDSGECWAQWRVACAGVSWTCDVLTSDPVTSVITIRQQDWCLRQITEEQIDYIPPTGVLVSVLRVSVFWLIIQPLLGVVRRLQGAGSDSQYVCADYRGQTRVLTITGPHVRDGEYQREMRSLREAQSRLCVGGQSVGAGATWSHLNLNRK